MLSAEKLYGELKAIFDQKTKVEYVPYPYTIPQSPQPPWVITSGTHPKRENLYSYEIRYGLS
jgi:hypothetical protein